MNLMRPEIRRKPQLDPGARYVFKTADIIYNT